MFRPITLLALPCALLLGACGGGNTTPAPPARTDFAQPTQISGKISDYNKLKGTLELLGKNKEVLSSATMKTTGDFTIDLPNATDAAKLSEGTFQFFAQGALKNEEGCTANVTLSNLAARVYSLGLLQLVQGAVKKTLASNMLSQSSDKGYSGNISIWLYASSAVSLTGEKRCKTGIFTVNIHLRSGWNQTFLSIADANTNWQSVDPGSTSWGEPTQIATFLLVGE